jgi:hypothetical protein
LPDKDSHLTVLSMQSRAGNRQFSLHQTERFGH